MRPSRSVSDWGAPHCLTVPSSSPSARMGAVAIESALCYRSTAGLVAKRIGAGRPTSSPTGEDPNFSSLERPCNCRGG